METLRKPEHFLDFCSFFEQCRLLWVNWSPRWNDFLIQDFLCFKVYTSTLWKKLFGRRCKGLQPRKIFLRFFVTDISRDFYPPTWRAWSILKISSPDFRIDTGPNWFLQRVPPLQIWQILQNFLPVTNVKNWSPEIDLPVTNEGGYLFQIPR